jgi:ABC-type glycerol-3-phosphate transport system substrate-binding protein
VIAAAHGVSAAEGARLEVATTQAPAIQAQQPVSLEVLTRAGVASPSGHSQFYDRRAKQIFTPETGITVNLIDAQPNVGEVLYTLAAGGTPPDMSWFGVLADGVAGREQAIRGIFKPIDDLILQDTEFDRSVYFNALLDAFSIDGSLYALPTHAHYGTNVLYYNKNMTQAQGVNVPADGSWSIDQFISAAQRLVRKDQDVWGYVSPWGFPEFGMFYLRQFGGEWIDDGGRRSLLSTPASRAGLEWIYDTAAKFQTIDSHYRPDNRAGNVQFIEGKLGFVNWTPGFVAEWKNPGPNQVSMQNGRFELGVALFPRGQNNRRGTQVSGSGMGITGTQKLESSWKYLKFITNQDNGVEQVFGGAGSPGGRVDVWDDPRLLSFDPIYSTILRAYPQGAGALRLPANNRYVDMLAATTNELTPYFRGEIGLDAAITRATNATNQVLSQGPAS